MLVVIDLLLLSTLLKIPVSHIDKNKKNLQDSFLLPITKTYVMFSIAAIISLITHYIT